MILALPLSKPAVVRFEFSMPYRTEVRFVASGKTQVAHTRTTHLFFELPLGKWRG